MDATPGNSTDIFIQQTISFKAGEQICGQLEPFNKIMIVKKGLIISKVITSNDGRQQILGVQGQGTIVGSLNKNVVAKYTVEAFTDVVMYIFNQIDFWRHAPLKDLLIKSEETVSSQKELLIVIGRKTVIERVAIFILSLLNYYNNDETGVHDGATILIPMTTEDIGCYLGISRERVSLAFTELKRAGLIIYSGNCKPKTKWNNRTLRVNNILELYQFAEYTEESFNPIFPI